jgi:hypothetical protein
MNNLFEFFWNSKTPNERMEIVSNQLNSWLPIQYQDFDFINYKFSEVPEPVQNWLLKYFKNHEILMNNLFENINKNLNNYQNSLNDILKFIGYNSNDFFEIEIYTDYKWSTQNDNLYFINNKTPFIDNDLYINIISSYAAKGEKLYMNSDDKYTYIMTYDDNYGYESATIMIFDNNLKDENIIYEE